MKKINLSKKQKISIAIALGLVCAGGVVGYNVVVKNMEMEKAATNTNVELYYVPDAEKVFINGKLVPTISKDFYVGADQGKLSEVKVNDGDLVKKDTLLYICKNNDIANQVDELKSELEIKKKERNNTEDEEAKKGINLEISNLEDKIKKLNNKTYSYIYAPFDGKVYLNNKSTDGNESGAVMTLQSTEFYIDGSVNEYDLFKINLEQEIEVMLYATKEKITGNITYIGDRPVGGDSSNTSSEALTEYGVKIKVDQQSSFRNGLHVQGIAKYAESNLRIPVSAVKEEDGKNYVYKVENEIAHKAEVSVIEKTDEYVVINSGINQGETIIRNLSVANIEDGQNIHGNNAGAISEGGIVSE